MYAPFFGLKQEPFSIAPDPRYLFMSERHREALAHLLYGVKGGGGFVLLTGEIGAGKTTVCRCFLEQIPKRCNVAYVFNPRLTVEELLRSVCDEFGIPNPHQGPGAATVKDWVDALNEFLLRTHAVGQNNVLIIDEAQQLSADVLEQLRLLTNLETNERKLLQIVLIGQPELRQMLARPDLEQLAQRVIARYHLEPLSEAETLQYIRHRLAIGGLTTAAPFGREAMQRVHQLSRGVPRRINLLCDRALLGAYATGRNRVDAAIVDKAASEVFDKTPPPRSAPHRRWWPGRIEALGLGLVGGAALWGLVSWAMDGRMAARPDAASAQAAALPAASAPAPTASAASGPAAATPTAAASGPVAVAAIADLKAGLQRMPRDEAGAWRALAPLWKLDLGEGEPCRAAQRQQVLCYKASGTLALIRQLDRPAILTLRDDEDRPGYALLTGLNARNATLLLDGTPQSVPLVALAQRWRGEFATLWRAPTGYSQLLVEGSAGPLVDGLAAQLASLQGEAAPAAPQTYGPALRSRVVTFQVAQGLKPDGLAGPTTFMQLNRLVGVDEPRLHTDY